MNKTYLIDGYNLIHSSDDLRRVLETFGMERARIELLKSLGPFSLRKGCECIVVFDGVTNVGPAPEGVRVLASGSRSADDVIRARARTSGRNLIVVSSDLEIIATARTNLATVISSKNFSQEIDVIQAAPAPPRDQARMGRPNRIEELRESSEKPNSLSDDEIDEWKKLFE